MDYTYKFSAGECQILTPGVQSMSEIRNEILVNEPTRFVSKSTYPNGFTIEMDQTATQICVRCNRELADNGDGTFTAPTK